MDMPKPGDVHKQLGRLVGEWSGEETLHPSPWDPKGGTAIGSVTNQWIVDGFAVVQEYEQRRGGQVTFRGHGVFWFDPATSEYVMHWWDSMGGTGAAYRGTLEGDRLMLGAPMPQGGHSRTSWTSTGPNSHTFLMEVSPDGKAWQPAMEGRYQRRGARKSAARSAAKAGKKAGMKARGMKKAAAAKRTSTRRTSAAKVSKTMAGRKRKSR
jgi:Protein of unknown function (DUF1579)